MLAQDGRLTRPLRVVGQAPSTSPASQLTRPDTVKAGLTSNRPRRQVQNDEYLHSPAASCTPTAAASEKATLRPWPSCSA
jgi:hypothetical protein